MRELTRKRVIETADYIIETGCTIRDAADAMGYCKTSVHKDMTTRLRHCDKDRYCKVRMIMDTNKADATRRGGMAIRKKEFEVSANV